MPEIDPEMDVVLMLNISNGETEICFTSTLCGNSQASELWWERGTRHYAVYHSDEFYDETLRQRRNSDNMISPRDSATRLCFVGNVWGAPTRGKLWLEIARTRLSPSESGHRA